MGRKSEGAPELVRVHIWLERDQLTKLNAILNGRVALSQGIRAILSAYLRRVESQVDKQKRDVVVTLPAEEFL